VKWRASPTNTSFQDYRPLQNSGSSGTIPVLEAKQPLDELQTTIFFVQIKSNILWRFFSPLSGKLSVDEACIEIRQRNSTTKISLAQIEHVEFQTTRFKTTVKFFQKDGSVRTSSITGISANAMLRFRSRFSFRLFAHDVTKATEQLSTLYERPEWINRRQWQDWQETTNDLLNKIDLADSLHQTDNLRFSKNIQLLRNATSAPKVFWQKRNEKFAEKEIPNVRTWAKSKFGWSLTNEQLFSIVCEEDSTLVVAGAGTGKSTTIVAKVAYLLERGRLRPEELLLLSFSKKTVDELKERIANTLGQPLDVKTFHSLGLSIISNHDGYRPSLSPLSEDRKRLVAVIENILHDILLNPKTSNALIEFVSYFRDIGENIEDRMVGDSAEDEIRTLRGEKVKSYGEQEIADFLTINGIRYIYEKKYEYRTATLERRQYKPDFFLPEYGIYIEYFGIDRFGNTREDVDRENYHAGIEWKRSTHQKNKTTLIELYFSDKQEGRLREKLSSMLLEHGIIFNEIPPNEIDDLFSEGGQLKRLAGLASDFLMLFKSNLWRIDQVKERSSVEGNDRERAFLQLFSLVYDKYQQMLQEEDDLDFSDMLSRATKILQSSSGKLPYRYVLVDEFQDISRGRCEMLKAILSQNTDCRLLCVGDDWQSIYRFTGSDVSIMTHFERHFGPTHQITLSKTFRFSRELVELSSRFIKKNRHQISKNLMADHSIGSPAVEIMFLDGYRGTQTREIIDSILRSIHQKRKSQNAAKPSVMFLARYNHSLKEFRRSYCADYQVDCRYSTVHSAKGLEADYVILVDLIEGKWGFPSCFSDDPLLNMVLSEMDECEYAEERRLFYVAITRARKQVYLLSPSEARSRFVRELESEDYLGLVKVTPNNPATCPSSDVITKNPGINRDKEHRKPKGNRKPPERVLRSKENSIERAPSKNRNLESPQRSLNPKRGRSRAAILLLVLLFVGGVSWMFATQNDEHTGNVVRSRNKMIFHNPHCKWAEKISRKNRIWYDSPRDALNEGFRPCKVCTHLMEGLDESTPNNPHYEHRRYPGGEDYGD